MKSPLVILFCLAAPLVAADRSTFYPFDITLGGTKAEMKAGNELFAEASKPGTYLANVVAENQTSRIVFTVAAPDAKQKIDFRRCLGS